MSTIEDKILNGTTAHYCDAEDDDIRTGDDAGFDKDDSEASAERQDASSLFLRPNDDAVEGCKPRKTCPSSNTGPKGVIEDYKKQSLQHKFSDLETEFEQLMNDDSILKEFVDKRLAHKQPEGNPTFGNVYRLRTGAQLLDAIDKENPNVPIVVHIYTKFSKPCAKVDCCLNELASELQHVKFVTIDASVAGLSSNFKENGVPAILGYKAGNLVKSLVQLEDLLDRDFDAHQLKELLIDSKIL